MEEQNLITQQINWAEEVRPKLTLVGVELVAWDVCFDLEFGSSIFKIGKLELAYLLRYFVPLLDLYFPPLLEKEIEQLLP